MGGLLGSFSDLTAVNLGRAAIKKAIVRAKLKGEDVQELIMGSVLPGWLEFN